MSIFVSNPKIDFFPYLQGVIRKKNENSGENTLNFTWVHAAQTMENGEGGERKLHLFNL